MAVTFSALLFTPEFVLNQFGAVLVLSSLLDTLLVRGFLVPSLLFVGGDKLLWWPNRMPLSSRMMLKQNWKKMGMLYCQRDIFNVDVIKNIGL